MAKENDKTPAAEKPESSSGSSKVAARPRPVPGKKSAPAPRPPVRKGREDKKGKASDPATENIGNLGTVVLRNEFYRDGYRSLLRLAVLQCIIIVALIGTMIFVINIHQPENRYFATTEDGRLIPMMALSQPNLSTPALMSWAAQAATEVMTFGFNDYKRRLQEASRNFTPTGWQSFTAALDQSRIIQMMEDNQQILTSVPRGAPILKSQGIVNGRYQWVIQMPMTLTYLAGSKTRNTSLLVSLVIVRVPRLESPNGVGIEQWISVPQ